jgi:hypothetical protein
VAAENQAQNQEEQRMAQRRKRDDMTDTMRCILGGARFDEFRTVMTQFCAETNTMGAEALRAAAERYDDAIAAFFGDDTALVFDDLCALLPDPKQDALRAAHRRGILPRAAGEAAALATTSRAALQEQVDTDIPPERRMTTREVGDYTSRSFL